MTHAATILLLKTNVILVVQQAYRLAKIPATEQVISAIRTNSYQNLL
jgi:hypothetical protein